MFLAIAALVLTGAAGGGKREGRGAGKDRGAKRATRSNGATLVAKFVAKDVGLAADKTDGFVTAYAADREAANKRLAEATKSQDKTQMRTALDEVKQSVDKFLEANLTAEQAKKAKENDLVGLERSVGALLAAKVEEAKIEEAIPVLAKYHKAAADLMAKAKGKEMSRADAQTKDQELRTATAKDLSPIVGEEAAKRWEGTRNLKGAKGAKDAGAGGKREGGKRNKNQAPATTVAPVAP
jgi:hypothetical protein